MAYQTINPATDKLLKTYEDISDAALNEVLDVAQACYENDWRRRSVAQRAGIANEGQREGMNAFLEKRAPVFFSPLASRDCDCDVAPAMPPRTDEIS